jgi:hypothetical protein
MKILNLFAIVSIGCMSWQATPAVAQGPLQSVKSTWNSFTNAVKPKSKTKASTNSLGRFDNLQPPSRLDIPTPSQSMLPAGFQSDRRLNSSNTNVHSPQRTVQGTLTPDRQPNRIQGSQGLGTHQGYSSQLQTQSPIQQLDAFGSSQLAPSHDSTQLQGLPSQGYGFVESQGTESHNYVVEESQLYGNEIGSSNQYESVQSVELAGPVNGRRFSRQRLRRQPIGSHQGTVVEEQFYQSAPSASPTELNEAYTEQTYVHEQPTYFTEQTGSTVYNDNVGRLARRSPTTNSIFGFGASVLSRDYGSGRVLARESATPTNLLTTSSADEGDLAGVDGYFVRRGVNGRGWEARYLGLFSNEGNASLNGPSITSLVNLQNINTSAGDGYTLFSDPNGTQSVTRSTDIHSAEANFLVQRSQTFLGKNACNREDLFGFRYFKFDESLTYLNDIRSAPVAGASYYAYEPNVENSLFGFQAGRRMELPFFGKFRLGMGGKLGVYHNDVTTDQHLTRQDSNRMVIEDSTIVNEGGAAFDIHESKNDVAFLGELNLGLIYQVTQRMRARVGYRWLGVSGIALAEDQIPRDFNDLYTARNPNTNGDLVLDGGYFGFEIAR